MSSPRKIFLSDDDADDREFFSEALNELFDQCDANLTIVNDGVELMKKLDQTVPPPPGIIFLDLNMPRKNGFECLAEIRQTPKLKNIPVVIFSTSSNNDIVDRTYAQGANFYICKPQSYSLLKKSIQHVLLLDPKALASQPVRDGFVVNIAS